MTQNILSKKEYTTKLSPGTILKTKYKRNGITRADWEKLRGNWKIISLKNQKSVTNKQEHYK